MTVKYDKLGINLLVRFKDMGDARIIGITNAFLAEKNIPFSDPSYDNTLFQERNSPIIIMFPFTTNDVFYLKDEEI